MEKDRRSQGKYSQRHVNASPFVMADKPLICGRVHTQWRGKIMNDASIADILKVYLGQNAGEAVLAGNMSRGKSLKVTAAVLIVDIRGSTPLLQKLGTDSYIDSSINCSISSPRMSERTTARFFSSQEMGCLRSFPNPQRPRWVDTCARSPFRMPTPLLSARTRQS
jgi:hypothetical protein